MEVDSSNEPPAAPPSLPDRSDDDEISVVYEHLVVGATQQIVKNESFGDDQQQSMEEGELAPGGGDDDLPPPRRVTSDDVASSPSPLISVVVPAPPTHRASSVVVGGGRRSPSPPRRRSPFSGWREPSVTRTSASSHHRDFLGTGRAGSFSRPRFSPPRRDARDARAFSVFERRPGYDRSSTRAQSVMHRFTRMPSPARSSHRDDSERGRSVSTASRVEREVSVLNDSLTERVKSEKDFGDDDVRIIRDTRRSSRSRSRSRRSDRRSFSRAPYDPFAEIQANIKKRPGDDQDPVCFDWDNPTGTVRDEPVTIRVFSDQEKAHFRLVMLDPTYATYPLEASNVVRDQTASRAVKTYEFEFTPRMFGPHLLVLTMDDFFRVQSMRVHGGGPPPPRRDNDNRPPLPRFGVYGVPDDMRKLFHAPRPRRDDEKFIDARRVLEALLG